MKRIAFAALVAATLGVAAQAEEVSRPPVWKTVTLGLHVDAGAYGTALRTAHVFAPLWYLPGSSILPVPAKIDLAIVSPRSLGLSACDPHGAVSLSQIFASAGSGGLRLCPAEVGPALRLVYTDQQEGETVFVAMEPVWRVQSSGAYTQNIYYLSNYRDELSLLTLNLGELRTEKSWEADSQFVFCLPPANR